MIEMATVKSIVDLFKDLLSVIDRRNEDRRRVFEQTCAPLYERMEIVAKEYHAIIHEAVARLEAVDPDGGSILDDVQKKRAALIIARNGVVGEARAFVKRYGDEPSREILKKGRFEQFAFAFATSVSSYFIDIDHLLEGKFPSLMTGLINELKRLAQLQQKAANSISAARISYTLNHSREVARSVSKELEIKWTEVAKRYTELKLDCLG
jgi:hypothetical protein